MNIIFKIFLIFTALITISCDNMYNDLVVEIGEYNYFLGVSQNAASGPTQVYSIDNSGLVGGQVSSQFYTGATPSSIAVHPTGNFLYVSYTNRLYIDVYKIDSDGSSHLIQSAGALAANPSTIKIHPSGKYLYCLISSNSTVAVFNISDTGIITSMGTPVSTIKSGYGVTPTKLTISPSGDYIYGVASNAFIAFAINADGTLPAIPTYDYHTTYLYNATTATNINFSTFNIIINSSGYLYAVGTIATNPLAYLFLLCFDKTLIHIDINTSAAEYGINYSTSNSGYLAIHPSGNKLFVGFYLSAAGRSFYYAYNINSNGSVVLINTFSSTLITNVSDLAVYPYGNYLYAANSSQGEIDVLGISSDGTINGLTETLTGIANAFKIAIIRKRK